MKTGLKINQLNLYLLDLERMCEILRIRIDLCNKSEIRYDNVRLAHK